MQPRARQDKFEFAEFWDVMEKEALDQCWRCRLLSLAHRLGPSWDPIFSGWDDFTIALQFYSVVGILGCRKSDAVKLRPISFASLSIRLNRMCAQTAF